MNGGRRYALGARIGRGGFGEVYLADEISASGMKRRVAVKILRPEYARDPDLVHRLRDEARIHFGLNHRAIVRAEDLLRVGESWCMVMEYVEGVDLAALRGQGPVPLGVVAEIGEEVAAALDKVASSLGLVHRDIKPQNIRMTADGDVKLLDFGIARGRIRGREAQTRSNQGFGTMEYMAPEQLGGEPGPASDVYALAVTLFELAAGRRPGDVVGSPERQRPGKGLQAEWAALAGQSEAFAALLDECLRFEPAERPSARDLALRLRALRARLEGPSLREWASAQPMPASSGEATPLSGSIVFETTPPPRSSPWSWAGGAAIGAGLLGLIAVAGAGLGLGAWFLFGRDDAGAPGAEVLPVEAGPEAPAEAASTPGPVEPSPVEATPVPAAAPTEAAPPEAEAKPDEAAGATAAAKPDATKSPARKTRAASPAPVEAAPAPPEPTGSVRVSGDHVSIEYRRGGSSSRGPTLAVGDWVAVVQFATGEPLQVPFLVKEGKTTSLSCKSAQRRCVAR